MNHHRPTRLDEPANRLEEERKVQLGFAFQVLRVAQVVRQTRIRIHRRERRRVHAKVKARIRQRRHVRDRVAKVNVIKRIAENVIRHSLVSSNSPHFLKSCSWYSVSCWTRFAFRSTLSTISRSMSVTGIWTLSGFVEPTRFERATACTNDS